MEAIKKFKYQQKIFYEMNSILCEKETKACFDLARDICTCWVFAIYDIV